MLLRARSNKKFWTPSLIVPGKAAGGGGLGLQTSLGGFWALDTNSWLDATGNGTTLSTNGTNAVTVGTGTGPGGNNCAVFDGTNWLSAASNTHIVTAGGSISVSAWVNVSALANINNGLVSKGDGTFGGDEWGLGTIFSSSNVWIAATWSNNPTEWDGGGVVGSAINTWFHIGFTYNQSTRVITAYVNGAVNGTPGAQGNGTAINSTGGPLSINLANHPSTANAAAKVALLAFWKGRVLTGTDFTNLYNSGNGLTYAAML